MHHVLLVEDDLDTRESIALVLELEGFRVTPASDGLEALETMRRGPLPCVVVADRHMPRLGGVELASAIASDPALAGLPCLVASGDPEPGAAVSPAIHAWLQKPFEADALVALLHRVVERVPCRCADAEGRDHA